MVTSVVLVAMVIGEWWLRRRHKLFNAKTSERIAQLDVRYGVLYENYKSTCFWWEPYILLRRLILTLTFVLMRGQEPLISRYFLIVVGID